VVTWAGMVLGGRYDLKERIGRGGYGEVWRATDTVLSRTVAVKLLYPGYASQSKALARFQAEARHTGSLSHQNIARVYDYGEPADGPSPYLVMEFVDGPSLSDVLAAGPLDTARSMDVIAQAAAGLQAAHAVGLVHRDVKPANLLLDSGGTVKITDFGIAHTIGSAPVTITGELIGTPGYLAPEQVGGARATSASDLYALGVVAYECLAGVAPFEGTPLQVALAHQQCPMPPLPSSVPSEVAALVTHLTAKDPAGRPGSAAEAALAASRLRDGLRAGTDYRADPEMPALARVTAGQAQPLRAGRVRHRAILVLTTAVLAVVTAAVLSTLNGFSSGSRPVSVPSSPVRSSVPSPGTGSPVPGVAAQPTGAAGTNPASPAAAVSRQPPASPAAEPGLPGNGSASPAAKPGHKPGNAHGHGPGKHGNANAQTVSTSP
jgi:eukaryotic-like serine/threonine-protein kinase